MVERINIQNFEPDENFIDIIISVICHNEKYRNDLNKGKVNQQINANLEDLQKSCELVGGNKTIKYLDTNSHLVDSEVISYQCMLNCGDRNTFQGHDGMRAHLRNNCAKARLKCGDCNFSKERALLEVDNHSCDVKKLKTSNRNQASEIEKLKKQALNHEAEFAQAKKEISQQAAMIMQMQETIAKQQSDFNQQQAQIKELQSYFNKPEGCTVLSELGIVLKTKLVYDGCYYTQKCYKCKQEEHCGFRCLNKCHYICYGCYDTFLSD